MSVKHITWYLPPKNKIINDLDVKIQRSNVERVYATKFLGVIIDSKLTWKSHIEYTCKKLAKCAAIIARARKKLDKSSLITLYYSFAYPYLIYCNHVWGNNYPTTLEKIKIIQKRLIRIITCSPYRAHTEPLLYANKLLNVNDINLYMTGIFMYQFKNANLPSIFNRFFVKNRERHEYPIRIADDYYVPYGRLDVRKFSIRITGANAWNEIPNYIQESNSIDLFKQKLRKFLIDKRLLTVI